MVVMAVVEGGVVAVGVVGVVGFGVCHLASYESRCCRSRAYVYVVVLGVPAVALTPFRTAVSFWGLTTWTLNGLSPKQDCGSKRVNVVAVGGRGGS